MSLCLLEFWVPLHKVSGIFALCVSTMVMDKSMLPHQIVSLSLQLHAPWCPDSVFGER